MSVVSSGSSSSAGDRACPARPRLASAARAVGLAALLAASAAALPPYCTPIPVDALGPVHEDCIRRLCDPATGACAFAQRLPDGTPCAGDLGVCVSGRCDCRQACGERVCGPDGCGGSCGECTEGEFCSAGVRLPDGVGPGFAMEIVGEYPDEATAVAVDGDVALLGARSWLFTLDISQAGRMPELGRVALPPAYQDITRITFDARKGLAYVPRAADAGGILAIVDVNDARRPRLRGTVELEGRLSGVAVRGRYAYVGGGADGGPLYTVDVSNPDAPVVVNALEGGAGGEAILHRGWLYALSSEGVAAFDLTDPLRPRPAGVAASGSAQRAEWEHLDADGDRLAAAGYSFALFDVSSPGQPRLLAQVPHLFLPPSEQSFYAYTDVVLRGGRAWVTGANQAGLVTFDVSDPERPSVVATSALDCWSGWPWENIRDIRCQVRGVDATPDALFVAHGPHGLRRLPLEATDLRQDTARFHTTGRARSASAGDGFLALATRVPGLVLVDVSGRWVPGASVSRPAVAGVLPIDGPAECWGGGWAQWCAPRMDGVLVRGTLAYATYNRSVYAVDVSDPSAPRLAAETPLRLDSVPDGAPFALWADDRRLVVLSSAGPAVFVLPLGPSSGLPAGPRVQLAVASSLSPIGFTVRDHEITVLAREAIAPAFQKHLVTFDVSDLGSPHEECDVPSPETAVELAPWRSSDERLLVYAAEQLAVIDLSVPCAPTCVSTAPLPPGSQCAPAGLRSFSGITYIPCGGSVFVVDPFEFPQGPAGAWSTNPWMNLEPSGFEVFGSYAVISTYHEGFFVLGGHASAAVRARTGWSAATAPTACSPRAEPATSCSASTEYPTTTRGGLRSHHGLGPSARRMFAIPPPKTW